MAEKRAVEATNSTWGVIVDGPRGVWRAYELEGNERAFYRDVFRMHDWGRSARMMSTVRGTDVEALKKRAFAEAGVEPDEVTGLESTIPPAPGPGESIAVQNRRVGLIFDGQTGATTRYSMDEMEAYYEAVRSIEARDGTPVQAWECEHESAAVMLMLRTHGPALGPVIKPDTRRQ